MALWQNPVVLSISGAASLSNSSRSSVRSRCRGPAGPEAMNGRLIRARGSKESSHLAFSADSFSL
jgi:hypothetical protein